MQTNITKLAIFSRLFIILLQCLSNILIEDHDAGVFKSPLDPLAKRKCDKIVDVLFGGFRRWDAEYFLHITEHGYTYENTLAFYPLYPLCIKILSYLLINIVPFLSVRALSLFIGVILNMIFFVKAANKLFELGRIVLRNERKAEIATILFCFNPASIFFSAPYSECLFSWLSFSLMLKCMEDINSVLIVIPLSLSLLCRSNGLLNIGFVIYYGFKKMFTQETILLFVTIFLKTLSILIIIAFHYSLMQVYNYYLFCFQKPFGFPEFIKDFAVKNNLLIAGNKTATTSPWCDYNIPVSYSYVQEHYWNVGYLKYWELKQLPNFVIAMPIIFIICYNSIKYFRRNRAFCWRLGIFNLTPNIIRKISVPDQNLLVFIVHAVAITVFSLLFIHVQVITRLLASSNPMLYWFCSEYFVGSNRRYKKDDDYKNGEDMVMNIFEVNKLNSKQKLVIYYFLGYYALGTILFSNFLPWT